MYGEVFLLQPLVNNVPKYHGSFPDINFTLKLSLLPFASYGTLIYAVGINWLFDESHIHPTESGGAEAPTDLVSLDVLPSNRRKLESLLFSLSDTKQISVNACFTEHCPVFESHLPF